MTSKVVTILDPCNHSRRAHYLNELNHNKLWNQVPSSDEPYMTIGPKNKTGTLSDLFSVYEWLRKILAPIITELKTVHGIDFDIGSSENTHSFLDEECTEIDEDHSKWKTVRKYAKLIKATVDTEFATVSESEII